MSRLTDIYELSAQLDVPITKLRRWMERLDIEPAQRVARGKHLYDEISVRALAAIKDCLEAGWEWDKLVRMFGSGSIPGMESPPSAHATTGQLATGTAQAIEDIRADLREVKQSLTAISRAMDALREDLTVHEDRYRSLLEGQSRLANALSVNQALLESLDDRMTAKAPYLRLV